MLERVSATIDLIEARNVEYLSDQELLEEPFWLGLAAERLREHAFRILTAQFSSTAR